MLNEIIEKYVTDAKEESFEAGMDKGEIRMLATIFKKLLFDSNYDVVVYLEDILGEETVVKGLSLLGTMERNYYELVIDYLTAKDLV